MDSVYRLNCPLVDMSPIAVEPDFTRKYLQSSNNEALVKKIQKAFDRVAWEKDFVLCEGSGHAGVGSVFDLSNAQVAKILGAKVIIVTQGGIGKPIDEVCLEPGVVRKRRRGDHRRHSEQGARYESGFHHAILRGAVLSAKGWNCSA